LPKRSGRKTVGWSILLPRRRAGQHPAISRGWSATALRSAAIAGVLHLPLLMVSDEIRNGQLVHLLPTWPPKRYVVHAVYPSKRGLLSSVWPLLDYLGARFSELRED
jgi:DNA-binding transcriptional LysR family regulator